MKYYYSVKILSEKIKYDFGKIKYENEEKI